MVSTCSPTASRATCRADGRGRGRVVRAGRHRRERRLRRADPRRAAIGRMGLHGRQRRLRPCVPGTGSAAAQVDHVLGVVRGLAEPDRPAGHLDRGRRRRRIGSGLERSIVPEGAGRDGCGSAGPRATFDGGGLRWIRVDGVEVLRGILLTARDADWRTLVPDIRGLVVTKGADAFSLDFEARFRGEGLAVDARVAYRGDAAGRTEALFDGRVVEDSVVQRLGLVVLHPADASGRPFEAFDDAGEVSLRGSFPELVSPERVPTASAPCAGSRRAGCGRPSRSTASPGRPRTSGPGPTPPSRAIATDRLAAPGRARRRGRRPPRGPAGGGDDGRGGSYAWRRSTRSPGRAGDCFDGRCRSGGTDRPRLGRADRGG